QQQAAQKAEAARLQFNKEADANAARHVAEEAAYQAALAKREKDGHDCETRYACGDLANHYTDSPCEAGDDREKIDARYFDESSKLDACLKAVWDPSTPNNRVIKA